MRFRTALILGALASGLAGCPAEEQTPLKPTPIGTIVGEAFVEQPELTSVAGAVVEVYGASARVVTEEGRQFVLQSIPLGKHTIQISHAELGRSIRLEALVEAPFQTVTLPPGVTTLKNAATLRGSVDVDGQSPAGAEVYLVGGNGTQVAVVGDDGGFVLPLLPPGPVQIGASLAGFAPVLVDVALDEGDNQLPDAFQLASTSVGDLRLAGRATLDELVDHRGTVVLLNGGLEVAETDQRGAFVFEGLAPGRYTLKALHPGYRSVELGQVALTEDGPVGLVDLFLAPGQDDPVVVVDGNEGEGEAPVGPLVVDIVAPQPFTSVKTGTPVVLAAEVARDGDALRNDDEVIWRVRPAGDSGEGVELGRGNGSSGLVLRPAFAPVLSATDVEIVLDVKRDGVTVAGDIVTITLEPLVAPSVKVQFAAGFGVRAPDITEGDDGVRVAIQESEPILLAVQAASGSDVVWTGAGFTFVDEADLSLLPVGEHALTVTVTDGEGAQATTSVAVSVTRLQFTVSVVEPVLNPATPYFADTGLPFSVQVSHGYQGAFPSTSVTWRDARGAVVGSGSAGRALGAQTGIGVLSVDVVDLAGHRLSADAEYQLDEVLLTASFTEPLGEAQLEQDTPLRLRVDATHSIFDVSTLRVRLFSNLQSGLRLDDGRTEFAPGETVALSSLIAGTHTLTARVSDGTRSTQDTRIVRVTGPFVTAAKIRPTGSPVILDGVPLVFEATVSSSPGVQPQLQWLLDGVEFDASWGGYGTDASAAARAVIDLGAYSATSFPFTDARWAPGSHVVQAFAHAPGVALADGCRDGATSRCLSFPFAVVPAANERGDRTLGPGDVDVWSGTIRMTGRIIVAGGTLIIEPGTKVVVATANIFSSFQTRQIALTSGTLQVGGFGAVAPVLFQKERAGDAFWGGIDLQPNGPTEVTLANVVIADAVFALSQAALTAPGQVLTVGDLTIEDGFRGFSAVCGAGSVVGRLTVRNLSERGLLLSGPCPSLERFQDLTIENVGTGIDVTGPGDFAFDGLDIEGGALTQQGMQIGNGGTSVRADIRRSTFRTVRLQAVGVFGPSAAHLEDNVFDGNGVAVEVLPNSVAPPGENIVVGNRFTGNDIGVSMSGVSHNAALTVQANVFSGNRLNLQSQNDGVRFAAQGNFIGDAAVAGNDAFVLARAVPGDLTNLPQVNDALDSTSDSTSDSAGVVLADNPLSTSFATVDAAPLAIIEEPLQRQAYRSDQCIPLTANAPIVPLDVDSACGWLLSAPASDPASGRVVGVDVDGCLDETLADGVHQIALSCAADVDGVNRSSLHATRFLVDSTAWRGTISRQNEVWSGEILVDGDVTIPFGTTLTVMPGTHVKMANRDRLRSTHIVGQTVFGTRSRLDLFVEGGLVVGAGLPRVLIEDANGIATVSRWNGVVAFASARVDLQNVDVIGAGTAVTGELRSGDSASAPRISITDASFANVNRVVASVCPVAFDRVDVEDATDAVVASCFEDFSASDVTLDDMRSGTLFALTTYDQSQVSAPAVALARVDARMISPTPTGTLLSTNGSFGSIALTDVSCSFCLGLLGNASTASAVITRADVADFDVAVTSNGTLNVADSSFARGNAFFAGEQSSAPFVKLQSSRFTDVAIPFRGFWRVGLAGLLVGGSQFEGASVVLDVDECIGNARALEMTNNNFVGTTSRVLRYRSTCRGGGPSPVFQTGFDLSGNFWGVTTAPEIEALIEDNFRVDANPADTVDGRTDYTGFSTTPLALTLPN